MPEHSQVLVVGSGAGGAATAATLASRGYEVLVLEEGPDRDTSTLETNSPEAIASLYRNGGVTPIIGTPNIAYVEGRCVGGSTEVNSAFWHRLPPDCYHRWRADARLAEFSESQMEPYFDALESELSVSYMRRSQPPRSSELFRSGVEKMRWHYTEVPRCQKHNQGTSPFAPGNKQSMQRTYIPKALAAGARLVSDCKALRLLYDNGRATGVLVRHGSTSHTIKADNIFLCCGAVQTAALLRRSRITKNVGNNLCIHPMLKVAALFDEVIEAQDQVLPIYQVKEFWPNIAIGGSVFTPGFLAMLLSDNWGTAQNAMREWSRMALYYTATRGMSRGSIRTVPGLPDSVLVRYRLTGADRRNISEGLAHLGEILFAAGARAVYPSLRSHPVLKSADQCRGFLAKPLSAEAMSLSTVHAFSSCPMGENPDLCATDSWGKVNGFRNLYVNDASLIPDSPGVNPQGTIMAIALRNVDRFDAEHLARSRMRKPHPLANRAPRALVTGAPGWLGTRLVEVLLNGLDGAPTLGMPNGDRSIRCAVHPGVDPRAIASLSADLELVEGDLTDPRTAQRLCEDAGDAVLFHVAGVVHPTRGLGELEQVNVVGTRHLLDAAAAVGVRRVVVVSSNSPFGFNPTADHVFDESSPYNPYRGYGRSKHRMELLVDRAQELGKIETVIIRPPWFYGPHQPARQSTFFKMIREGRFPIVGDGRQKRSMAYVDNICQGLLLAATVERANGQKYWIADERPYSILEIVETVRQVLEEELGMPCKDRQLQAPEVVGTIAGSLDGILQSCGVYNQKIHVLGEMGHTIACSIDKAVRELGYSPKVTLHDGMGASVRWCLANGQRF